MQTWRGLFTVRCHKHMTSSLRGVGGSRTNKMLLDVGGGVNEISDVQYRIFFEYSKLHYALYNALYESELFVLTTLWF